MARQSKTTRNLNFFADLLGGGISKLGRGASDAIASRLYGADLERANEEARRVDELALRRASTARASGDINKARRLVAIAKPTSQVDIESTLASGDSGKYATNKEILTGAGQTALQAITAPLVVANGVRKGIALGAGLGALNEGAERFSTGGSGRDVAESALAGGVIGGTLGGLGSGAVKVLSKIPRTRSVPPTQAFAPTSQPARSITPTIKEVVSAPAPIRNAPVKPSIPEVEGVKMRSFSQRVASGVGDLPQEVRQAIKSSPASQYTPTTLKEIQQEGRSRLQEGADSLTGALNRAGSIQDAPGISALIDRAKQASSTGDFSSAQADLLEAADNLTRAGQAINSAKILRFVSPEGMQVYGAKLARRFGVPEKSMENLTKRIGDISQGAGPGADNLTKQQVKQAIEEEVSKARGGGSVERLLALRKAGMLTSPTTTIKNVIGNTLNLASESAKDIPAAAFDTVMSLRTGERAKSFTGAGVGKGAVKGMKDAFTVLKTGIDPNQVSKFNDVTDLPTVFSDRLLGKIGNAYTEAVFRSLAAQDKVPYGIRYVNSLEEQARVAAKNAKVPRSEFNNFVSEFVNNPSDSAMAVASSDAARAVFSDQNALRTVLGQIKSVAASKGGAAGKVMGDVVLPFTGVPASVTNQAFAYSPTGLIKGAMDAYRVMVPGVPNKALQRQAAEELARGAVGSAVIAAGLSMAKKGLITGEPKDDRERELWKVSGKQANSLKIGNKWYRVDTLSPQLAALWVGSRISENERNGKEVSLADVPLFALRTTLNQSPLQGVQGVLESISDPQRSLQGEVNRAIGSVIPSVVGRSVRAADVNDRGEVISRDVRGAGDALKQSIPGLRTSLPARRDVFGDQITQGTSLQQLVDPFSTREDRIKDNANKELAQELTRLSDIGFSATPTKEGRTITFDGAKIKLTPFQYEAVQRDLGSATAQALRGLISSESYQQLSDEEKSAVLKEATTDTQKEVLKGLKSSPAFMDQSGSATPAPVDTTVQPVSVVRKQDGKVSVQQSSVANMDSIAQRLQDIEEVAKVKKDLYGEDYSKEYDSWEQGAKELYNARDAYIRSLSPSVDSEKVESLKMKNEKLLLSVQKYRSYGRAFRKADSASSKTSSTKARTRKKPSVRVTVS